MEPVPLSTARAQVLVALREEGRWCSVKDLAARLGQHTNTVREHLDALVEAQLVEKDLGKPKGRGRPALMYQATRRENGPGAIATLALLLSDAVAGRSDAPQLAEQVGREWGRALVANAKRVGATSPGIVEVSRELGFDPDSLSRDHLMFRACPLLAAARRQQSLVCGVHAGMLRELVRAGGGDPREVKLHPMAAGGGCVLEMDRPAADAALLQFRRSVG